MKSNKYNKKHEKNKQEKNMNMYIKQKGTTKIIFV